jgi:acetyltransferase-like isoleucine patch superfamily enzyme
MNLNYWLRRLAGRATCQLGAGAVLKPAARILNARGDSGCVRIGDRSIIEGELFVFAHGGEIVIGHSCFIGSGARIWSADRIQIGDRVLISHNVNVFDSLTHPLSPRLRHQQFNDIASRGHPKSIDLDEQPISIGDDAWIGAGATILRGVAVGARAIVGAGSVVTRPVPAATIVAGNPAVIIRQLTASELE